MILPPLRLRNVATDALAASAASVFALSLAARAEGRGAWRPLNATSHWLNGEAAAHDDQIGWRTTGVGLLTHVAATTFWAVGYEVWLARGRRTPRDVLGKAAAMAGISALVDYRATPKRFTPGWEFVLSAPAMAFVYFALSAGLAAAAVRRSRPREQPGPFSGPGGRESMARGAIQPSAETA